MGGRFDNLVRLSVSWLEKSKWLLALFHEDPQSVYWESFVIEAEYQYNFFDT